jgi:hypothetical protein
MKAIKTKNKSYLKYSIESDRIWIDNIKSFKKGDGSTLIQELKKIAARLGKPIELFANPQDNSISEEDLGNFYIKNHFDLHPDDIDGTYYVWG